MPFLAVEGISKRYGSHPAVDRLSFSVAKGECLALLGPSGCGKTTLLNMVAGFIAPDAGDVTVDGRSIAHVPPHRRDFGMVFQDYALFPHLSVAENVEFGLRMRQTPPRQRREAASRALDLVGLAGFGDRGVHQLSGGQRQRVAVARALAISPRLLLFDEPLSNLDARLRDTTRAEIRALLTRTGITALFVTHDQAEAFAVADRIALMNSGRMEQIGGLDEIYERPASRFVASFLGSCNLIEGKAVAVVDSLLTVDANGLRFSGVWRAGVPPPAPGAPITLAIRPHHIEPGGAGENRLPATITAIEYLGWVTRATAQHPGGLTLSIECPGKSGLSLGGEVELGWSAQHAWPIQESRRE